MSEATPFKSDGMGNGFPFCLDAIDVVAFQAENDDEGYGWITHWTTLGGYNKDAFDASTPVTDEQIELSLQNAMKLFWNLEKVTGEASHASSGASVTEMPVTSYPDGGDLAPKDRVCKEGIGGFVAYNLVGGGAGMTASIGIIRMVAGDTFLGYGIPALPRTTSGYGYLSTNGIHAGTDYPYTSIKPHVALWSMATEEPFNYDSFAYTVKNGIHFVGYAQGSTMDATVPSATAYLNVAVARIDELEFFTYP